MYLDDHDFHSFNYFYQLENNVCVIKYTEFKCTSHWVLPNVYTLQSVSETALAPHSSTLAWKIPRMEEPGRLQSMGSLSRTWLSYFTFTFCFHALEKEMATHSSVLAWRIPGMGEPGGLPCMGSHRVGHDWSDLANLKYSSQDLFLPERL